LSPAPDAPRFVDGPEVPPQFAARHKEMAAIHEWLATNAPDNLDWLFISPADEFGAHAPGEPLGTYRTGDGVALFDDQGKSRISGADFALAIVDEIDHPKHHRTIISFAY
jgi:putative NADH-flavin reductase